MPTTGTELTPEHLVELGYMARANAAGMGLYGPSLTRRGPVAPCEDLVRLDHATLDPNPGHRRWRKRRGYRITDTRRRALAEHSDRNRDEG